MHRMNANRVSDNSTSMLDDASINRIKEKTGKKTKKRAKSAPVKKTAKKTKVVKLDDSKRVVIASLSDIPKDFEHIGTGFYRKSHHLWQLMPEDSGFVLVRKGGEDHILGYDPEPAEKVATTVIDRKGVELKQGSRVSMPYHGKIAMGTIVVLSPDALGVDLDQGGQIDVPSDMLECVEESDCEEHEEQSDKQSGGVFDPELEDMPSSDYVGPQSSQSGGIGGVAADKEAQITSAEPSHTLTTTPSSPAEAPGFETYEQEDSRLAQIVDEKGAAAVMTGSGNEALGPYLVSKVSEGNYKIDAIQMNKVSVDTVDAQQLIAFENQLGDWYELPAMAELARNASREITLAVLKDMAKIASNSVDISSWKDYWHVIGQRVAQKAPKKPKMTDEEKKQKSKERRKQKATERAGLPKGTTLPGKSGKIGSDDLAKLKEYNKLYEQTLDEIEYALNTMNEPQDDVLVADEMVRVLDTFTEEKARLDEENEEETEDSLSLDEPSVMEMDGIDINRTSNKQVSKIVVGMSEL